MVDPAPQETDKFQEGPLADPKKVGAKKRKADRDHERDLEDLRLVASEPFGRRFLWRLLIQAGIFKLSYTGNADTYFNEGMRSVGNRLLAEIDEAFPEAFDLMRAEARKEKQQEEEHG